MKVCMLFLLTVLALPVYSKTLVISDVDDTVKYTNSLSSKGKIINALFSSKTFAGMSELYQGLSKKNETTFFYVSGSPHLLQKKIESMLEKRDFPNAENLITKKGKQENDEFKIEKISAVINSQNPDKIILIGDDTEFDPEVYVHIADKFPGKVEAIYIHAVQNRTLPAHALLKSYFSPVEIAGFELQRQVLNMSDLESVSKIFQKEKCQRELYVKHRYCPDSGRNELNDLMQSSASSAEFKIYEKAQEKIKDFCGR